MRNFRIRAGAVLCAMAVAVGALAAAGPASASPGPDVNAGPFAAQVKQVGLTAPQAADLQGRVDGYLRKLGGKQVAINKIQLKGGTLTLTLPGETAARDLAAVSPNFAGGCAYYYFCEFQHPNYLGDRLDWVICGNVYIVPWGGAGSYANNQTHGTQAIFLGSGGWSNILGLSVPAPGAVSSIDWSPIYYDQVCQ